MPRVVLHKDTVCPRGGQLGGEDSNREWKEHRESGGGAKEVGKRIH